MSRKSYCCGWCDAPIRKGMACGSIYHPNDCYWAGRVAEVGVAQAVREGRQRSAKPGYFISDHAIRKEAVTDKSADG